jgi:hypothetical protein
MGRSRYAVGSWLAFGLAIWTLFALARGTYWMFRDSHESSDIWTWTLVLMAVVFPILLRVGRGLRRRSKSPTSL